MMTFDPVYIAKTWLITVCDNADSIEDFFDECQVNALARNYLRLAKAFRFLSDNRAWLDSLPRWGDCSFLCK